MEKKDIILFASIFCVLSLIAGGTYAYWGWRSAENKSLVFNTSHSIEDYIIYDEGDSHFVGDFQPSASYCDGMSNTLSFSLNTENMSTQELEQLNKEILVDTIKMDVNFIGSNTSASNSVYWVVTSGDATTCPGSLSSALNYGTFNGVSSGTVITLLSNEKITTTTKTFTVWIWVDSSGSNLSSLTGETIDVNIWSQIDMLDASGNYREAGLYDADGNYTSWDTLIANGDIIVSGTSVTDANTSLAGELIIADNITSIENSAFSGCSNLTNVVIPEGVTSIGSSAFQLCSSLTSIVIPEGVTSIESFLFNGCSSLTSVVIPAGVTSIGSTAFQNCSNLTDIVIPESVTSIGSSAFKRCSSLVSINIPEGVTTIGSFAFQFCTNLTSVVIPEGVTTIGEQTFRGCTNLTSVVIPSSVTTIENSAFSECTSLANVYYGDTSTMWNSITIGTSNTQLTNATIHYNSY